MNCGNIAIVPESGGERERVAFHQPETEPEPAAYDGERIGFAGPFAHARCIVLTRKLRGPSFAGFAAFRISDSY